MAERRRIRLPASLSRTLLVGLWLAASLGMIGQRWRDLSAVEPLGAIGFAAGLLYIPVLIWHLIRQTPAAADLPDLAPLVGPERSFRWMLWAIIGGALFLFGVAIIAHPALVVLALLTLGSLWLIVAWRQQVTARLIVTGAAISAGLIILQVAVGKIDAFLLGYLACLAPLFIAGVLLARQTGLSRSQLADGRYVAALRAFARGALLAVPPAQLNVFWGAQRGDAIDQGWKALAALTPGVAEEIWARLALTTLLYALLRPTTNRRPSRAVAWAVLLAAMIHAQAHSPTQALLGPAFLMNTLNALLYGVPLGLLFVKRDLEHAVGYHFAVDFVRFLAAWLWP